ncbi:MAG: TldD/PmbA family protein [Candidatus Hodarchaeales archaeon]
MLDKLTKLVDCNLKQGVDYIELRFQDRHRTAVSYRQDELNTACDQYAGVGIRVLYNGVFGTSATSVVTDKAINREIANALKIAKVISISKNTRKIKLRECQMMKGNFKPEIKDPLRDHSIEEKIELVKDITKQMNLIKGLSGRVVVYDEIIDRKTVVNSDGAAFELEDSKVSFTTMAIASKNGESATGSDTAGITGGWEIFRKKPPEEMAERSSKLAIEKLEAKFPRGGYSTLVLDPATIGLIAHEAIGHACEADSYLAGSIAKEKFNTRVGEDFLTIVDEGVTGDGCGWVAVDDEGVRTRSVELIKNGILVGLMHNRETAELLGDEPTGNARAWEYDNEPLIRMRNTYVKPGDWSRDEIIEDTRSGYLLMGPGGGGEADSNTEFELEPAEIYEITKGEISSLLRTPVISGNAFTLLGTIDAISKDGFSMNFGSSYCIKQQQIKVDGGGTFLRCKALVGGVSAKINR